MREVVLAAPVADDDGGEVWAAELDDDDEAYEPLEVGPSPAAAAAAHAAAAAVASRALTALSLDELPTRAQTLQRLCSLFGALSHEALAALPPGEWGRLGLGDALRAALAHAPRGGAGARWRQARGHVGGADRGRAVSVSGACESGEGV